MGLTPAAVGVTVVVIVTLIAVALTVGVHELGHAAAAIALGLPVRPVVTRHGPGMAVGSDAIRLTHAQISLTCAAGPAANLAAAAVCHELGIGLLVLTNVVFAIANLVPLPHSDGLRILRGYGAE